MMMNRINYNKKNSGVVLVMVLVLVMTVAIVSIGFIARGNTELLCGENAVTKAQMDYLAESGLEHARGLILNPQDVSSEYWTGDTGLQLVPGSSDYYDVTVTRTDYCDYEITSTGYRMSGGQKIAKSSLTAELRLDSCIGFRTGDSWISEPSTKIYGDVYCKGAIAGSGNIYGDAYAKEQIYSVYVSGRETEDVADGEPPVALPKLDQDDFKTTYRIGSSVYSVTQYAFGTMNGITLGHTAGNPAGIYYHNGNLEIDSNVEINGMLVVNGDLKIIGTNNTITAEKNFPATIIDGKIRPYNNSQLTIKGLAYVRDKVEGNSNPTIGASLTVVGALFIKDYNIDKMEGLNSAVVIRVCADKASYKLWDSSSTYTKWSPAGGAFFKNINRVQ